MFFGSVDRPSNAHSSGDPGKPRRLSKTYALFGPSTRRALAAGASRPADPLPFSAPPLLPILVSGLEKPGPFRAPSQYRSSREHTTPTFADRTKRRTARGDNFDLRAS